MSHFLQSMYNYLNTKSKMKKVIIICFLNQYTWNFLWDMLRLPSSCTAAIGLYVILTLWRARGANQRPYSLLHIYIYIYIYNTIHMYSGITSGRVLNGELLYTKILEVNLFAFAYRLFRRDFNIYIYIGARRTPHSYGRRWNMGCRSRALSKTLVLVVQMSVFGLELRMDNRLISKA